MYKRILIFMVAAALSLAGCSVQTPDQASVDKATILVTDLLGREVEVQTEVERVVAIGPGALRLYTYVGGIEKVVGIEQMEKDNPTGRAYTIVNSELMDLPVIGAGGPHNAPDPEKLLTVAPDVIFCTYVKEKADADKLQEKTGIPVIALSYGKTAVFDASVNASLELIGEVVGEAERADALVAFIESCKEDLDVRTAGLVTEESPSVYVGALGARGAHGIESTQGNYALFNAIHAENVVDETGQTGSVMIDKEQLLAWNPDKIFIDAGGFAMVEEDYKKNPEYYKALKAFSNKEVYLQLPYNYYSTNIDTAIIDAYYQGSIIYKEAFEDIDPVEKAHEIYTFFVGESVYDQMKADFGGFKTVMFE